MGIIWSQARQVFPPKSKFSVDDIPDLTGKVVIITGSNTGIGKETVKALLVKNATVYMATRSQNKADEAIAELQTLTGKSAIYLQLDLSDLKSIKAAAEEFISKEKNLHVLFNNAGVMLPPVDAATSDGYDLQFGTNVLGHFYFTKLLLPVLLSTAESSPPGTVRVVNSSSSAAYFGRLKFATFKDGPTRRKRAKHQLYAQSKYGNVVFMAELARRYGDKIVCTSLNPGNIRTDLQRYMPPWQHVLITPFLFDAAQGALTQLWAGTTDEGKELNGQFLVPWARVGRSPGGSQDEQLGKELWSWCEEQVKDM